MTQGPRKHICGDWIGRAMEITGSGPWYVDATEHSLTTITAAAGSSGTWVRVTSSCAHGARISTSDPAVASLGNVVTANDNSDVAVLVVPRAVGHAELTATSQVGGTRTVTFEVTTPPALPTTSGIPPRS